MNPDIKEALHEVASTGRHPYVVERVLDLMLAVHKYGHALLVRGDTLTDVAMPENCGPLPLSLCAEIDESYDDIVELSGAILGHDTGH